MGYFDALIGNGASNILDPVSMGLVIIGFFIGWALLARLDTIGKIVAAVGGALLAVSYVPFLTLIVGLILTIIVWLAIDRLFGRR